ncbi:MAG TPA: potassium transporter TrkA [Streptosporangiaceae bacterium]
MKISLRERVRYWFDNTMSRGTPALVGWLALVLISMIILFAVMVEIFDPGHADSGKSRNIFAILWMTLLRAMDPGTIGGDKEGVPFLTLMLGVTLGGIFVFSALVGVIATGLDNKITELRKGRSRVLERNHTVLLGWSDQVFTMISELVEANASERRSAIAILADKDKVEMEDEIRDRIGRTGRTRIVCRTGTPIDPSDLDIVNPDAARSIIVLTPQDDDPDAHVVKALLAITSRNGSRRRQAYHIVATVSDGQNLAPARLAGGAETQVIDAGDVAARLVVQSARQSGLSVVYTDLLDFGGDEIYMKAEPILTGHTFDQALFAYDMCTVIGLQRGDGTAMLNPPMHTRITEGDRIIAIAEDDSTMRLARTVPPIDMNAIVMTSLPESAIPERTLMLGWNARASTIITQLDNYVAPGSVLDIVADSPEPHEVLGPLASQMKNMIIRSKEGDATDRTVLESLGVGTYQHVMVLGYDHLGAQQADSRTLVTLLHLRDMEATLGERYSIVSEMADDRNRTLAQVTQADDFIVSDKLISLLMTQISENRHLAPVFADLFDSAGSEIYLKPVEAYVALERQVTFATLIDAARRRGEVAIGFRIQADIAQPPTHGVALNPPKNTRISFTRGDRVIVLAKE